jgi:hypothetical protein
MALARVSIPCGILMDRTSWSARFACGLDSGKLSAGKGSVPCKKRSNRDPVWPCGEIEMGHSAMLSLRIFLMMSSPVKVV